MERLEVVGTRFFSFSGVYFSRGTLQTKKGERRALLGDLVKGGGGGFPQFHLFTLPQNRENGTRNGDV